ncbi:phage holin family protein [Citricoccus sp.]|uniref:phage holin family protein n=1 Tax=Citricoccus sp. TaxID=1978372 RepID=UPI0028BEC432|nr:phage holin family protein [Citricoccus sp.]
MIRMLLQAAINVVMAAVGLLVAGAVIEGVTLNAVGFVAAVLVFVVAQAILGPFVFNLARQYASAILGGIGIVSTFLALWIATLIPDGLSIEGVSAWVLAPLLVWVITALGMWLLGFLVLKRWWDKRAEQKTIRRAVA